MLVVRNVQESDLDSLFDLIGQSELGLTTLKISKEKLQSLLFIVQSQYKHVQHF